MTHDNPVLDSVLTLDQLKELPKPQPLITGDLNLNSLAWIAGEPGSYKTFLALDYALRIATKHTVLYVAGEGTGGLYDRVAAWLHGNPSPLSIGFLPRSVAVTSGEWLLLCEAARTMRAGLIVIDTQARMSGGLDENSAGDMGRYVEAMDALRQATGACVLSVHHSSKGGSHLRGSSVMQGAADTIITTEVRDGIVGVSNLKQKDMVHFPDRWYRPTNVLDSCVLVECDKPEAWDTPVKRKRYANNQD